MENILIFLIFYFIKRFFDINILLIKMPQK